MFALSLGSNGQPIEEPKRIFSDDRWIASSSWVPGGQEVLFTLGPRFGEEPAVWRIAASGKASPRRLAFAGADACCATFSADGRRLVYSRLSDPKNLYRLDLRDGVQTGAPVKLASSTRISDQPDFSPDGQKIVFTSSRSGEREIWVCDRNGRDPEKLTSFGPREIDTPRWSPDGRQIVFSMRRRGDQHSDIFTVRADGGGLNRLTADPENHNYPAWSRDGRWIYFTSDRAGEMNVWKMRPDGRDQARVTDHGGFAPQEAVNGEFLFFLKPATMHGYAASLWKLPLPGRPDIRVLDDTIWAMNYVVTAKGIYYIPVDFGPTGVSGSKIKFFDFSTGKTRQVASAAHWPEIGLALSPDGSSLIDSEDDMLASDVMMVENFR